MLTEREIGQKRGDKLRRLFSDENFYLFVWYDRPDAPWGFQLIYRLPGLPLKMVTFRPVEPAWLHHALDEGGDGPGGYGTGSDLTPLSAEEFARDLVVRLFGRCAAALPRLERDFVSRALSAHPVPR